MRTTLTLLLAIGVGVGFDQRPAAQDQFWVQLEALCGNAYD